MAIPPEEITKLLKAQKSSETASTSSNEFPTETVTILSLSVLVFTFMALILSTILLWRQRSSAQHVLRIFGILSIVGVSAFLIIVGYSNEQLTPIIGLFGAIAGYLLGKDLTTDKSAD